jgi:hypothetical protein
VKGYAGNTVVTQEPVAGSIVQDTGAPRITLTLSRNANYPERGEPDNRSPYAGTTVLLPGNQPASRIVPRVAPIVRPG